MTPKAFSYPTVGQDNIIYIPPYGLTEELNYMLAINPITYASIKIPLSTNNTIEKYTFGTVADTKIYWLPYGESRVLVYNTTTESVDYIDIAWPDGLESCKGKFVQGHVYKNKLYALPYGEDRALDYAIVVDLELDTAQLIKLNVPTSDCKKWHQSVIRDGIIYAVPRGGSQAFNYIIEFDCNNLSYILRESSQFYPGYEQSIMKFTTIAIANGKIYAPPYSYQDDFDFLLTNNQGQWASERTGITQTTRKYFTHVKTRNNKLYFPPAGHHVDWNEFLVIDGNTGAYKTIDIGVGVETKKYFAGVENSQGLVFFIPRGGCVCQPPEERKQHGDLAQVLVVDSANDSISLIDISDCFTDSTTIEKYNACCLVNDIIFAMPYGESDTFHTMLAFDTISKQVIKTINLNEL